ncbi:MAG: ABC transporter permease [Clostridia bacterium]|nr:ABC transporter permease [Clostridia bacterium]
MNSVIIAINIFRRLVREVHAIAFLLIFPVLGGIFCVVLVSHYEISKIGITYILPKENALHKAITDTGKFEVVFVREDEIEKKLKRREIEIGLILPKDFESKVLDRKHIQIKVQGLKQNANLIHMRTMAEYYMQSVYTGDKDQVAQYLANSKNNIPAQRGSIGFLLLFILLFTGTCMELLLEDKKCKTFMRTFCAPVKEYEMVIGNVLACLALGVTQILIFLLVTKYIFHFDWKLPITYVFLILFSFLLSSVGISVGLIGFIHDNKVYSMANALISLFTCFIGGALFSSNLMGETMDKIASFFPQKWAMRTYEKMVDGSTLYDVSLNLAILILFGAVFFTFGIGNLKPTDQEL